jgi:hypothetical protein
MGAERVVSCRVVSCHAYIGAPAAHLRDVEGGGCGAAVGCGAPQPPACLPHDRAATSPDERLLLLLLTSTTCFCFLLFSFTSSLLTASLMAPRVSCPSQPPIPGLAKLHGAAAHELGSAAAATALFRDHKWDIFGREPNDLASVRKPIICRIDHHGFEWCGWECCAAVMRAGLWRLSSSCGPAVPGPAVRPHNHTLPTTTLYRCSCRPSWSQRARWRVTCCSASWRAFSAGACATSSRRPPWPGLHGRAVRVRVDAGVSP